ncbi:GNAT family N-acetyltransferase [Peristeroidobacter soli]|uniref:GNAT family N-acetyltransferase n=1 Tax=Peristeroidobacter soli TaxID=2497877 RepID=UPI00101B885C|nr:N-acetyltransferase [Peristeroidobacter soli]
MNITPDSITFRKATASDAVPMAELGGATFTETFGHLYPPEDLQNFLSTSHSPENWARSLNDPNRGVFVVEHRNGRKIGFIVVGACKLPVENLEAQSGEIQQLYVLAEFHNLRLGRRLMELGLEWLASQGRAPLYIGVWSENYGAQRFYERYGFSKVGEYGFPVGKTVDREFILKR